MIRQDTKTHQNSRAVGYVRRSTDRQEQSIEDQKKALQDYAAEHGLRLAKFYVDDAISGTSTLGRRAFQQMIQDAKKTSRPFDTIVVYDVKRFGRIDNDEAGYYRHILRTNGVEVHYTSENFNGDTTDDLLRPVKQWQARQESKDLSKVTIRGLLSKSETGSWMGGVPPYGYDLRYENCEGKFLLILHYMPDGSKQVLDKNKKPVRTLARGERLSISKRDCARLVFSSPERVKVARQIFNMYVDQGKGYKSIAHTLNSKNIPAPRNSEWSHIYSGTWTDTTLRAILVNPIYAGDMVWNRRTDARFHRISNGQAVVKLQGRIARPFQIDVPEFVIRKGKISDAYITKHMQDIVQAMPEEDFRLPHNADDSKITNEKTNLTENLEMAFLRDIKNHPEGGIAERYKRLGISVRQGQKIKARTLKDGLIEEHTETIKTGRIIRIRLTEEGWSLLSKEK